VELVLECMYRLEHDRSDFKTFIETIQDPTKFQPSDPVVRVRAQIEFTRDILITDLGLLLDRSGKLEDMLVQSNVLREDAKRFENSAQSLNSCCVLV